MMPPSVSEVPLAAAQKPNPRNNPIMFKIFQNVQYNVVQHKKYVKEMIKLYKKLDEESFRESFKNALYYLFTFGDTSANVDRVVQFVATFCTSLDDEEEFLLFIIDIIFECQCVSGQSVRYRATQLLAAVLSSMGEDASLDDDLCQKLLTSQMQRLQDARGALRCRAALALQRLQNPMDPDDEVTTAYRFHMSCDLSSSVRRAIVMTIAKCNRNVPYVIERLRDSDEAVRRAAFLYIAAINVTQLRVRQRVLTLKVGLTERSQRVRRVVEEILIPGWLATFKGNIVDLLKAIRLDNKNDVEDSKYVAGKLLESLFKRLPLSELLEWLPTEKSLRLIPGEKLNKETAWYWRHLAEHLQKIEDDETLETILPDLVVLTGYIRAIVQTPCPSESEDPVGFVTRQYVLHELAAMLKVYDVSDPTSRTSLQELVTDVLTGDYGYLSPDVIRELVWALELAVPEVSRRIEMISGVITSLRDPPEPEPILPLPVVDSAEIKMQKARLRVSLNVAMEAQEEAVRIQNYALAAEHKSKVEELQKQLEELAVQAAPPLPPPVINTKKKTDPETITKCLTILNSALDTPQLTAITPMLKMIFEDLEVEILQNPAVLETSLQTIALYGMLDKEFVMENKPFLFAQLIDTSNEPIVTVTLRCIVDLLCVHGARVFELDTENNATADSTVATSTINGDITSSSESYAIKSDENAVINILLKIMDSACATYRQIIVEGLCRLLHLGHLESPAIISRLLLLWFNPATDDEDMLRQIIGVFFQTFPACVDGAQEQIQKATIPTLKTLAKAPSSSPLAEIDQEAVVRFIVTLTRVNHELSDSQGGMAEVLVGHLARRPAAPETGLVCRMLALLSPPRDATLASSLAVTLRDLCLKLPDKQSCRNLTRYLGNLEAFERASMNKMSQTGITEGTMQEDSLATLGRTTNSLPQPIARSTHVVINDTVIEESEIDETSPTDVISRISEGTENSEAHQGSSTPKSRGTSSEAESGSNPTELLSDSDDVSPEKKPKLSKGKKKKLSTNRKTSDSDSSKPTKGKAKPTKEKSQEIDNEVEEPAKEKQIDEQRKSDKDKGRLKRTRSQRSPVDVDIALKQTDEAAKTQDKEPKKTNPVPTLPPDLDVSNVTVRPSLPRDLDASNVTIRPSLPRDLDASNVTIRPSLPRDLDASNVTIRPSLPRDLDASNVTVRRSTKPQSGSGSDTSSKDKGKGKKQTVAKKTTKSRPAAKKRDSTGSNRSSAGSYQPFDDSDDSLHTIVYEKDFVQSVLNDSDEQENRQSVSRGNVTIPETPDASDESDLEPSPEPKKKVKKNGNKK